jgi:hypothetical protein
MTPYLILTRLAIVGWVWWALLPFELVCDSIDDELERRGVWLG